MTYVSTSPGGKEMFYRWVEPEPQTRAALFQKQVEPGVTPRRELQDPAFLRLARSCQHHSHYLKQITAIKHLGVYLHIVKRGISYNKMRLNL